MSLLKPLKEIKLLLTLLKFSRLISSRLVLGLGLVLSLPWELRQLTCSLQKLREKIVNFCACVLLSIWGDPEIEVELWIYREIAVLRLGCHIPRRRDIAGLIARQLKELLMALQNVFFRHRALLFLQPWIVEMDLPKRASFLLGFVCKILRDVRLRAHFD